MSKIRVFVVRKILLNEIKRYGYYVIWGSIKGIRDVEFVKGKKM